VRRCTERVLRASLGAAALLLALGAGAANAACQGVRLFPAPGSTVPTNSRFILEGLGEDQARVSALVGKKLVLEAQTGGVELTVQRAWKSAMSRVAVWLKPEKPLKPGLDYQLVLGGPLKDVKVLNAPRGVIWHAGAGADPQPPSWKGTPIVSEGENVVREGSLSRHVKIHLLVEDESPVFLVITARPTRGNQAQQAKSQQTYFVPIDGDEATLGHDACNGSFYFADGEEYHARVQLFDAAGHAGPTADIQYFAPAPQ
jgi:hypothetical protein